MAIIFRVETEEHVGPYDLQTRGLPMSTSLRHPSFENDGLPWPKPDEKCGFESLDALFDWFGDYLLDLQIGHMLVVHIDVPDHRVKYGIKQLLFDDMPPEERTVWTWQTVFRAHKLYLEKKGIIRV